MQFTLKDEAKIIAQIIENNGFDFRAKCLALAGIKCNGRHMISAIASPSACRSPLNPAEELADLLSLYEHFGQPINELVSLNGTGTIGAAQLLLAAGLNVNKLDFWGFTPLDHALDRLNPIHGVNDYFNRMVLLLRQNGGKTSEELKTDRSS